MSLEPFTYDRDDYLSDPEPCNEALGQWMDNFLSLYYESPEYSKLSKANQKSGGQMFHMFMELNLNYLGKDLSEIDKKAAKEVMIQLFPRKMICSDTQAKTIVPELIACWQCLRREIDGGTIDGDTRNRTLKHADAVIKYLESIKKDYLKTYKGDVRSPALSLEQVKTMMNIGQEESDWVLDLIEDTVENLAIICKQPAPPESWSRLYDHQSLSEFFYEICIEGIDAEEESEAIEALLSFALQFLFMHIRQGNKEAAEFWQEVEQNIISAYEQDELDDEVMPILLHVLTDYRQYLSEDFITFSQDWQAADNEAKYPDDAPSMEDLKNACLGMVNELEDEFAFATLWQDQMGFMPADGLTLVAEQMLSLGQPRFGDFLALLVLDERKDIAVTIAELLAEHADNITPLTLDRMVRIRNWLPDTVQKAVDKLIRNARKKGITPGDTAINHNPEMQVWMTIVDGSGAQGVMAIVPNKTSPGLFRMVNFVLKEAVGIVDISISPPLKKSRLTQIVKMTQKQGVALEKVSAELIRKQIPLFIAMNLQSKTAISHELVEAMELLGLENWNPEQTRFEALYPELTDFSQPPSDQEIAAVQKRSGCWPESDFGDSWLISEGFTMTFSPGGSTQDVAHSICDDYLETKRELWRERMLRLSQWAQACDSKQRQKQARDFAVVGWLLHQDLPARDIKLLEVIARRSIP